MEIVSVSLDTEAINHLNLLTKEYGFPGNSEAVRTGLSLLVKDKSKGIKKGNIESVLLVVHDKKAEQKILDIFHENNELIHMRTHNCLSHSKCLETLIVKGDSKKIDELLKKIQRCKPQYLDLITP